MIRRIISKLRHLYMLRSSKSYVAYLRSKGVMIGNGTYFQSPKTTEVDISRPSLISIGCNCFFNDYVELISHDWVTHVFLHNGRNFINSSGRIKIGNNVAFGRHVLVLKGVTIGDNSFIGAGSIVTRDIPANSIAAGIPCKVITTIEKYYQKRLSVREGEAFDYARSIQERFNRRPVPADFWEEFPLFVSGDEVENYPEIPIRRQLGPTFHKYINEHKAKYSSFEQFLTAAGL